MVVDEVRRTKEGPVYDGIVVLLLFEDHKMVDTRS